MSDKYVLYYTDEDDIEHMDAILPITTDIEHVTKTLNNMPTRRGYYDYDTVRDCTTEPLTEQFRVILSVETGDVLYAYAFYDAFDNTYYHGLAVGTVKAVGNTKEEAIEKAKALLEDLGGWDAFKLHVPKQLDFNALKVIAKGESLFWESVQGFEPGYAPVIRHKYTGKVYMFQKQSLLVEVEITEENVTVMKTKEKGVTPK